MPVLLAPPRPRRDLNSSSRVNPVQLSHEAVPTPNRPKTVAVTTGLEPATFRSTGGHSNQLSYATKYVRPTSPESNHIVRATATRFPFAAPPVRHRQPSVTPRRARRSARRRPGDARYQKGQGLTVVPLGLRSRDCAYDWNRTSDLRLFRAALSQLSYEGIVALLWRIADSNRSPSACRADALPDELIPQDGVLLSRTPYRVAL